MTDGEISAAWQRRVDKAISALKEAVEVSVRKGAANAAQKR